MYPSKTKTKIKRNKNLVLSKKKKERKICMLTILEELKLRSMEEKEKGKRKAQPVYPGQSLRMYSNLINQNPSDFLKFHWSHLLSQNLK